MRLSLVAGLAVIMLSGCATPYGSGSSSLTGGYYDEQLEHNTFKVTFSANGYTSSERASDLAIMRACELALSKGFNYVVVFDAESSMNEDVVYTGYGVSSSYKPVTQLVAVGLLREPTQYSNYYDAAATFAELATKNEITAKGGVALEPEIGEFAPNTEIIQFEKMMDVTLVPDSGTDMAVIRGRKELDRTGFPLARFTFIENPMMTIDEFVEISREQVTAIGGNALVIEDRLDVIHARLNGYEEDFPKTVGFVADVYYLPAVRLGVTWDSADLVLGKYVVRRAPDTESEGLLIGDRVLQIGGIAIDDFGALAKASSDWQPGDNVPVLLIRSGREQTIDVELQPAG
ncbi:MAG: PDZ domain-containing protein [Pseudomonadota bacterium]